MKQVLSDVNYSVSVSQIWFVLYRWLSQRRVTGIPESPSPSWLRPWAARPLLFIVINYLFNTNTVRSSRYGANSACSYCCTYLLTFAGKTYFFCTSTYEENERIVKFNIGWLMKRDEGVGLSTFISHWYRLGHCFAHICLYIHVCIFPNRKSSPPLSDVGRMSLGWDA